MADHPNGILAGTLLTLLSFDGCVSGLYRLAIQLGSTRSVPVHWAVNSRFETMAASDASGQLCLICMYRTHLNVRSGHCLPNAGINSLAEYLCCIAYATLKAGMQVRWHGV